eukprot:GHRQ01025563.1.p1 GENE.GHRQ01025563.1~~GHRQ01025563.1.p1  ORF type:complete len:175 (+),score=37.10 GHRQ01025563.1:198-722(+)
MAFDEGGIYYAFQGDEDQQDLRPREQTIADFKAFITKFYPANQQQTFIYRQAAVSAFFRTRVSAAATGPCCGLTWQQALVLQPALYAPRASVDCRCASCQHDCCYCRCRDKLMKNQLSLEVDLVHVREFNQELGDGLENKPAEYLPLVSSSSCRCCGVRSSARPADSSSHQHTA